MLATQGRDLYVFPCVHGPAKFHLVKHSAFRDPFGLLLTLKEKNLVDEDIQWKLLSMHPSVMTTGLARHGLVIGVLEEGDRDPATEVFVLFEKTLRPRRSPQEAYRNYVSLWADKLYERQTFLRLQGMFAVCQIHECISYVNGDVVQPGDQLNLLDGAFLQLEIRLNTDQKEVQEMEVDEETSREDDVPEPEHKRPRQDNPDRMDRSHSSSGSHPPVGTTMMMVWSLWIVSQAIVRFQWPTLLTPIVVRSVSCTVRGGSVRFRLWILLSVLLLGSADGLQFSQMRRRIGEASHPGPEQDTSTVWLGTTNPSGLRNKEWLYGTLPYGVWNVSETHLSEVGQRSARQQVGKINREHGRNLHLLCGAATPLRARSAEAGNWTGVAVISDLVPRPISIFWPQQEYDHCRVQLYQVLAWSDAYYGGKLVPVAFWPNLASCQGGVKGIAHYIDQGIGHFEEWPTVHLW